MSLALGDFARRAGGVGGDDRLELELADDVAALAERHHVALHGLDGLEGRALRRHQLVADRQKPFGDDVQLRSRHQVMDVGDAAGDRILDRDHAEIDLAGGERGEAILEGRAGHRLVVRIGFAAGEMRIRPRLALKNDLLLGHVIPLSCVPYADISGRVNRPSSSRAFSRSSGVSTPSGTLFTTIDVDAHAGVERAQLLQPLALLVRRRRQLDEALERGAPVSIEPDVVIMRAGARWHRRG